MVKHTEHSSSAGHFETAVSTQIPSPEKMLECILRFSGYVPERDRQSLDNFFLVARHDPPAPFVEKLLNESIVLERSPPITETLAHLFHSATSTSLGVLVGMHISPDPLLMLVTVPGGILLMGAAFGVSKGLERGLSKAIEGRIVAAASPNTKRDKAPPKPHSKRSRKR